MKNVYDIGGSPDALNYQPKVLERKSILGRVADKIENFINTFVEGMGGSV